MLFRFFTNGQVSNYLNVPEVYLFVNSRLHLTVYRKLPYVYARSAFGAHFPKPLRNPKSFLKFNAATLHPK